MKTQALLGNALKGFMATKPLDTISVIELTKKCNVDRQTFYYHFRNIYDLLTWVFLNEKIEKPLNNNFEESLLVLLTYIKHNEALIVNTLQSAAKDLVKEFFFNNLYNIYLKYIDEKDEDKVLTSNEVKLIARVYASGVASSLIAWVEGDITYTESEFVIKLSNFFASFPEAALYNKGTNYGRL